jgi:predicted acylesterase/phospholipase RssA/CRP-like cAMP-binding protein
MTTTDAVGLLARTTPFSALPTAALADFADACERMFVHAGDTVLREDDPGERAFVVVSGRLRVYSSASGPVQVAELGPGQLFGEMALLNPGGRRFSIVAGRDSELLTFGRDEFDRLVTHPDSLLALLRLLVDRARSPISASAAFAPPNSIAVIGVGAPADLDETVAHLTAALATQGAAICLDAALVERNVGDDATEVHLESAGPLLTWLDRVERSHQFVVYRTDPARRAWTDRSLRHADRILLVVDAGRELDGVTLPPLPAGPRCDVVVRHDSATVTPHDTSVLLDRLCPARHFHIRRGHDGDMQRVARQLAGTSVGLVLGGGGARGFAHLGVLRALEEASVPIDTVGGTSVGALIGALAAWGLDHGTRMEQAHRFVAGRLTWPTLPIVSATSGGRITARLRRDDFVGDRDLLDSWLPFFCVSTNLSTAQARVHLRGPAWQALRASISLPGVMPPVCTDEGELLVDGGLVNDLPVDVMTPLVDGGRVVAVDLGVGSDFKVRSRFEPTLSGWNVLFRRLSPFGPRFDAPSLLTLLLRAKEVASRESLDAKRKAHEVALLLRPPVDGYGGFDFRAVDALTEASYRYTLDLLESDEVLVGLLRSGR